MIEAGHLIPSGVPGVYGRGSDFEDVRGRFDAYVTRVAIAAGETPEVLRFPPVLPRKQIEELGYLENFPHLAGTRLRLRGHGARRARDGRGRRRARATGAGTSTRPTCA